MVTASTPDHDPPYGTDENFNNFSTSILLMQIMLTEGHMTAKIMRCDDTTGIENIHPS